MTDQIKIVLSALGKVKGEDCSGLDAETRLANFDLDSLDTLELVLELERMYSIEIEPSSLVECDTVFDVAQKLEQLVKADE